MQYLSGFSPGTARSASRIVWGLLLKREAVAREVKVRERRAVESFMVFVGELSLCVGCGGGSGVFLQEE